MSCAAIKQRQYEEGAKLDWEVLRKRTETLGTHHPSSLNAMAALACSLRRLDREEEAEELEVRLCKLRKSIQCYLRDYGDGKDFFCNRPLAEWHGILLYEPQSDDRSLDVFPRRSYVSFESKSCPFCLPIHIQLLHMHLPSWRPNLKCLDGTAQVTRVLWLF